MARSLKQSPFLSPTGLLKRQTSQTDVADVSDLFTHFSRSEPGPDVTRFDPKVSKGANPSKRRTAPPVGSLSPDKLELENLNDTSLLDLSQEQPRSQIDPFYRHVSVHVQHFKTSRWEPLVFVGKEMHNKQNASILVQLESQRIAITKSRRITYSIHPFFAVYHLYRFVGGGRNYFVASVCDHFRLSATGPPIRTWRFFQHWQDCAISERQELGKLGSCSIHQPHTGHYLFNY